jgi:hypothetical protein
MHFVLRMLLGFTVLLGSTFKLGYGCDPIARIVGVHFYCTMDFHPP